MPIRLVEFNFGRSRRRRNIVAEEGTIRAVRFLLDRHRELRRQVRGIKATLPKNSGELAGEGPFVCVTREKGDRLAALSSTA